MEVLLERQLMKGVKKKSELMKDYLKHSSIKNIRSAGLLMCIEFENEVLCQKIAKTCIEKGVIVDWFLFAPNCLRIAPPLIISAKEIEEACSIILQSINIAIMIN